MNAIKNFIETFVLRIGYCFMLSFKGLKRDINFEVLEFPDFKRN